MGKKPESTITVDRNQQFDLIQLYQLMYSR